MTKIKKQIKLITKNFFSFALPTRFIISIVKKWADTGENSDKCLKKGFLPVPVHFYHSIPDIKDLEERKVWDKVSPLSGISFEPQKYLNTIKYLGKKYSSECSWPNEPTKDENLFYLNNSSFSYGCAAVLHSIIREFKPKRIFEIGSGNSSKIIYGAIKMNEVSSEEVDYVIIDPFCNIDVDTSYKNTKIYKKKIEDMEIDFFKQLNDRDILFIDSSHMSKIGSDVNFEILEILPILNKGVLVHFHDINLPYEYPKVYATKSNFRVFWNESYLLQSFLTFNNSYEILLPMAYVQREFGDEFRKSFPESNKTSNYASGSFWIRRT
ncbi:MAG: class I SAM-dependent methyltransferase [bacterium]